ncbi:NAD-dependent epimerase/dehydratase family protein [Heyndrickxia ginsengihumi]|uniref:NAD-dependent epimerase/dehydratase family protein n=1 Tax=Heyndrickxia ginsengihumi TaxID=363870 RepID=UPI003D207D74
MKAVVFGGTGFIGSHVVEQLCLAGHQVTTVVRNTSDLTFLESLGVEIVKIDFSNQKNIGKVMEGNEVVYNCTANANLYTENMERLVEINLTQKLIEAAALHGIIRFIQLSSIVIYDFSSDEAIDESYIPKAESVIQKVMFERENIIQTIGKKTGIETVILRPASTIGVRDKKSFFSRLFTAYLNNQFPLVGKGDTKVSLIDTRDIGRAMEWLGKYQIPKGDNGIYLLKGFDTTWYKLKKEIDRVTGKNVKTVQLPMSEETITVKNFTVNRIWNDRKIKSLGFHTKYTLTDAVESSVRDILSRDR